MHRNSHLGTILLLCLLGLVAAGCSSNDADVANGPATNPFLSAALYGITHFDPSQSDSTPYGPPNGTYRVSPEEFPIVCGGPVNIITLASTNASYMWGVGTDRVAYIRSSGGQWIEEARINAPAYMAPTLGPIAPAVHLQIGGMELEGMTSADLDAVLSASYGQAYSFRLMNSTYSAVDNDNVLYANYGNGVYAFALVNPNDPSAGIAVVRSIADIRSIQGAIVDGVRLFGLSMTYDGHLLAGFSNGLAVIDRSLDPATAQFVPFGAGETLNNSMAVDENNGIYIATDKYMRKYVWTGTTLSALEADGAWVSAYDAPTDAVPPMIKFGLGTGSTPTLMGFGTDPDKLVVITDGCKQMKLVAFWRDEIPDGFVQRPGTASRRIAGQIQVTCGFSPVPEWIQSEQSVVVSGYGAFVVNNIPANAATYDIATANKILGVAAMGPMYAPPTGAQRFAWNPVADEWTSVWARSDVSSTSMVPIHSRLGSMALVNGYTAADGWEVTGMDWTTGATVHRTIFGHKTFGNGAYAILQYLNNGDLVFNSFVGPYRVSY